MSDHTLWSADFYGGARGTREKDIRDGVTVRHCRETEFARNDQKTVSLFGPKMTPVSCYVASRTGVFISTRSSCASVKDSMNK
jgi:hypothetical protein